MAVMEEKDLELMLLAIFYHCCKSTRDRAPGVPVEVDPVFGLPTNPGDLVSPQRAVAGHALALSQYLVPGKAASAILTREINPQGDVVSLLYIPRQHWTEKEVELVDALEFEIKVLVARLTEEHQWFYLTPDGGNPYEPDEPLDLVDGLTQAFKITHHGLKHALEVIPGSKYSRAPNLADRVPPEDYAQAADWFRDQEKRRG